MRRECVYVAEKATLPKTTPYHSDRVLNHQLFILHVTWAERFEFTMRFYMMRILWSVNVKTVFMT